METLSKKQRYSFDISGMTEKELWEDINRIEKEANTNDDWLTLKELEEAIDARIGKRHKKYAL